MIGRSRRLFLEMSSRFPPSMESFASFVHRRAAEVKRAPAEIAQEVARGLTNQAIEYELHTDAYPYSNPYGGPPPESHPLEEEFLVDLTLHIERVAVGIDAADFERLRFILLDPDEARSWLDTGSGVRAPSSAGTPAPITDQMASPSEEQPPADRSRAERTLLKIIAALSILSSRELRKARPDGTPIVDKLAAEIAGLLESDKGLCAKLGVHGLGRSTVSQHITDALNEFKIDS
jgi:hypothetical protein